VSGFNVDNIKAIIVQVLSKEKRSHLVAIVKGKQLYFYSTRFTNFVPKPVTVPEAEHLEGLISPWFLFNDFLVQNISEEEALSFPGKWKVRHL
jgi:hypothetical protein